jgi:hypothetical protein
MLKAVFIALCGVLVNVSSFSLHTFPSAHNSLNSAKSLRIRDGSCGVLQLKAGMSRRDIILGLSTTLLIPSSALAVTINP